MHVVLFYVHANTNGIHTFILSFLLKFFLLLTPMFFELVNRFYVVLLDRNMYYVWTNKSNNVLLESVFCKKKSKCVVENVFCKSTTKRLYKIHTHFSPQVQNSWKLEMGKKQEFDIVAVRCALTGANREFSEGGC